MLVGVGGVSLALLVSYIGYQKLTSSPQPEPQKSKSISERSERMERESEPKKNESDFEDF